MKSVIRIVALTFAVAVAATIGLFSAFPGLTARAEYVLRGTDGELVVCRKSDTVMNTGIDLSLLRSRDRQSIENGIRIRDDEALARALEDFGK